MKQFLKKSFLFGGFLLVSLYLLLFKLDPSWVEGRKQQYVEQIDRNVDYLVMGSSRAEHCIKPNVMDTTKLKVFNIGEDGHGLPSNYLLLKVLLEKYKVQINHVVLQVDEFSFNGSNGFSSKFRDDYFVTDLQDSAVYNAFCRYRNPYIAETVKDFPFMANVMYNDFYKFVRRYPLVFKNRIKFLERSYQKNIAFFGIDKGYSPFFPDPNVKIENYRDTIEADDLDYFERFVDLCNRNHIKLYLFRAPILECERSDSREFDEYIHTFTQKNNIPYLDLKCYYQIHSQYWTQTHPADSLANLITKDVEKFLLKY